jgi:hypothetical protein
LPQILEKRHPQDTEPVVGVPSFRLPRRAKEPLRSTRVRRRLPELNQLLPRGPWLKEQRGWEEQRESATSFGFAERIGFAFPARFISPAGFIFRLDHISSAIGPF